MLSAAMMHHSLQPVFSQLSALSRQLSGRPELSASLLRADSCELQALKETKFPVVIEQRSHPFPFRTRQLSSASPMILRGQLRGKVGRRRDNFFEKPLRNQRLFAFGAVLGRVVRDKITSPDGEPGGPFRPDHAMGRPRRLATITNVRFATVDELFRYK